MSKGRYFVESYGCQMSMHDAERLAGLLERDGYVPAQDTASADVVVVNTCSVRERAESKLYTRLGELREEAIAHGREPVVAVAGCVAQQEGEAIARRASHVDVIVGTQAIRQIGRLADAARARTGPHTLVDINPYEDVSFPLGAVRRTDPVRAWVTIIEGCNDFCSFCVVPYTRGHERMRPASAILAEVRDAVATGHREIQLLGQIVNHYEAPDEAGLGFADLLERVAAVPGVDRLRFASPHPRHVTARLIDAYRRLPNLARHLHLPVQSGSSRILAAMRRRHTREQYLDLVARLRDALPEVALSTDMIVGFPGETPEDFEETLSLVRTVRFHSMFSFKYSPRPGTLARQRYADDVSEGEKTRRIVALQELQRSIQLALHEDMIGTEVDVLVDGASRRREHEMAGRTSGNTVVNFPGEASWLGQLVRVRVERAGANSIWGRVVGVEPVPPAARWGN